MHSSLDILCLICIRLTMLGDPSVYHGSPLWATVTFIVSHVKRNVSGIRQGGVFHCSALLKNDPYYISDGFPYIWLSKCIVPKLCLCFCGSVLTLRLQRRKTEWRHDSGAGIYTQGYFPTLAHDAFVVETSDIRAQILTQDISKESVKNCELNDMNRILNITVYWKIPTWWRNIIVIRRNFYAKHSSLDFPLFTIENVNISNYYEHTSFGRPDRCL